MVLGAFVALVISMPVLALQPNFAHLETIGESELQVAPDMAKLKLAVSLFKPTAIEAKEAADKAVAALMQRLNGLGVAKADIISADLTVQPRYDYEKDKAPVLQGYQSSRVIEVTVRELEQLNTIIDGALADKLNRVDNINFMISNKSHYVEQVRMAAIEDAKNKAAMLAKGFDRKLGGVWQIRYNSQGPNPILYRSMSGRSNTISESYTQSFITLTDRVEVIFALVE